jgi:hypothetical protein
MVYFRTKKCKFLAASEREILVYVWANFVHFISEYSTAIWNIYSHFGMLYHKESGNPASHLEWSHLSQ